MDLDDLPSFDFHDVMGRSPNAFLAQCRREMPLVRLVSDEPDKNIVMVVAPDAVLATLTDGQNFSSTDHPQSRRFDSDHNPQTACIYAQAGRNLKNIAVWSDGSYHSRVRRLIQTAFSLPQVAAKAPYIQQIVDGLLDDIAADGAIDFVPRFANRLPTMVITREFGLKPGDVPLVRDVTDKVSVMSDTLSSPDSTTIAAPAIVELQRLLIERLDRPDELPEACLLRQLAEARLDDEPALSRDELMWLATLLLAAGGHTTAGMLSWCAYMLAARPDLQERLRRDPELAENFVEETLRVHGPVPSMYRRAARDTEIAGVRIPRDTTLVLRTDSINFDENRWDAPQEFDIDRPNVRRHSTFGNGEHFCIGNLLTRRELTITVASMVRRFDAIAFGVDQADIQPLRSFDVHILTSLPLVLREGASA